MPNMPVQWKEIPGCCGYEVSDRGQVRSWRSRNGRGGLAAEPHSLRLIVSQDGYLSFNACVDGIARAVRVSRAVLLTFRGPQPPNCEARHLNGVRADNSVENLVWSTHRENISDKVSHGTSQIGERHPRAKLCNASVLAIRDAYVSGGVPKAELAASYGVSYYCVWDVLHRSWRHIKTEAEVTHS